MGSAAQNILRRLPKVRSIMKTLVLAFVLSVASGSPVLMDTPEVAAEKEKFAAAFKAAEAGEHAKLAPVNTDVQEPAPVFGGKQIPEAFLEDTAPVAEARSLFTAAFEDAAAGGLAAKQAPAPEFTGMQIENSYLEDFAPVVEARSLFTAAFDDAAAGGLAAKQVPAPEFSGVQIANSYLEDLAPVAEARSLFTAAFNDAANGGLAAKQEPAPKFSGVQIPHFYLENTIPVAEARAAFKAAFDDAAAGGLPALQAAGPPMPVTAPVAAVVNAVATPVEAVKPADEAPVAAVKSAAVTPVVASPAVGAPLVYAHHFPYTYHAVTAPKVVSYTGLTHPHALPLTYTHTLPYAGFYPLALPVNVPLDSNSVEETKAVETE